MAPGTWLARRQNRPIPDLCVPHLQTCEIVPDPSRPEGGRSPFNGAGWMQASVKRPVEIASRSGVHEERGAVGINISD